MINDERSSYTTGIEYLKKTGLDLIVQLNFIRIPFKPGSYLQDKTKETLRKPYGIISPSKEVFSLSVAFMDRFKISTVVDMNRMIRACSIILTNFDGPGEYDDIDYHIENLREMLSCESIDNVPKLMLMALHIIEEIIGIKKEPLPEIDYQKAVNVLNVYFKLW